MVRQFCRSISSYVTFVYCVKAAEWLDLSYAVLQRVSVAPKSTDRPTFIWNLNQTLDLADISVFCVINDVVSVVRPSSVDTEHSSLFAAVDRRRQLRQFQRPSSTVVKRCSDTQSNEFTSSSEYVACTVLATRKHKDVYMRPYADVSSRRTFCKVTWFHVKIKH